MSLLSNTTQCQTVKKVKLFKQVNLNERQCIIYSDEYETKEKSLKLINLHWIECFHANFHFNIIERLKLYAKRLMVTSGNEKRKALCMEKTLHNIILSGTLTVIYHVEIPFVRQCKLCQHVDEPIDFSSFYLQKFFPNSIKSFPR